MRALIAVMAVAWAACGGGKGAEEPAPVAETAPVDEKPPVDRAMMTEIAAGLADVLATMATISEGSVDCPTMASQLEELFDKSAPLFELARTNGADPDAGPVLTAEVNARAAEVQPLIERISTGLGRCQMDPDVARVIEKMPTL